MKFLVSHSMLVDAISRVAHESSWIIDRNDGSVDSLVKKIIAGLEQHNVSRPDCDTVEARPSEGVVFSLPPEQRFSYSERGRIDGKRLSPPEFLAYTWGDLAYYRLIYSEHLRLLDPQLHRALCDIARRRGLPVEDYLFDLGILSLRHVLEPDEDIKWQANTLNASRFTARCARLQRKSQEMTSIAEEF